MADPQVIEFEFPLTVGNIDINFVGAEGAAVYVALAGTGETALKIPVSLEQAAALHGGTIERQVWRTSPLDARPKVRAFIHLEIT